MNDKVDTRVVRMEFDNKQFEKNIKQTNKSLENLKQNLDFKGVGEGLDKVRLKFSALQVATTTFVAKFTNKIINLGTTLVKSLSVDNIASGWTKFGEKTISVATMMAQKIRIAGQEIEDYAQKTEIVNELLEKLAWFADETSYSFSDMTNYVGKFIAAGQDLDKSVKAMEGIATWAAMSGQNSQTASRAMMQLAQAMGRSINRQDWSSIQTANMDTETFREKVLETAVALGELSKEGDKFVTKTGKKFEKSGFLTYFSEGWFTSDVLVETLNKYSAAVDEIYKISEREGITASEVIEKYGDTLDKFGKEAFLAAQEARTFNDVLSSVKDAVSSKWMQTFELFFGGKDEAVQLWTELANELYDVFAESGNFRNSMISVWKEMGGRNDIFGKHGEPNQGAFWNLYDAVIAVKNLITEAFYTIFPISEMEDEDDKAKDIARSLKGITNSLNILTESILKTVKEAKIVRTVFEAIFKVIRAGLLVIQGVKFALEPIFYTLKQLVNQVLYRVSKLVGGIDGLLTHIVTIATKLNNALWSIMNIIDPSYILDSVFNIIEQIYNIISNFDPIGKLVEFVNEFFRGLKEGGGTEENFIKITRSLFTLVTVLTKAVLKLAGSITQYILPVLDKVADIAAYVVGLVSGIAVNIVALIADIITAVTTLLDGGEMSSVGESIRNFLTELPKLISKILPILASLLQIVVSLINILVLIPKLLNDISIKLTGKGIIDNLKSFFDNISKGINDFANGLNTKDAKTGTIGGVINSLIDFFGGLNELLKGLVAMLQASLSIIGGALKYLGIALQTLGDVLSKIFTGRWKELTKTQQNIIKTIAVLAAIAALLYMVWSMFYRILAIVNPISAVCDSLTDAIDKMSMMSLVSSLNTIANAFLKFSVALYLLNKVDHGLLQGLACVITLSGLIWAISYMFKDLTEATSTLSHTFSKTNNSITESWESLRTGIDNYKKNRQFISDLTKIINTIANTMIKLAVVALIFDNLKSPASSFAKMVTILGIMIASVVIIMSLLNKNSEVVSKMDKQAQKDKSFAKMIAIMLSIIMALRLVIEVMKQFEGVSWESFGMFLITFHVILGTMVIILNYISKSTKKMTTALATIGGNKPQNNKLVATLLTVSILISSMAAAIVAIAGAIKILSTIDIGAMWSSISAVLALIAGLVGSMILLSKFAGSPSDLKAVGGLMLLLAGLAGTTITLAASLLILSRIPIAQIISGGLIMSVLVASLAGAAYILSSQRANIKRATQTISVLATLSGIFVTVATSIALLAALPTDRMLIATFALASIFSILAIGISKLSNVKGGAAGIKKIADAIWKVGAAILFIGGGISLVGAGLYLIGKSIDNLIGKGPQLLEFMANLGAGVASMLTSFVNFAITGLIPVAFNLLRVILDGTMAIINEYTGPITQTVINSIITGLTIISNALPTILPIVGNILMTIITWLFDFLTTNIPIIVDKLVSLVSVLIQALITNLPKILEDITNLVIGITEIIAEVLPQIIFSLWETVIHSLGNIWNSIMQLFGAEGLQITEEELEKFMQAIIGIWVEVFSIIKQVVDILKPIFAEVIEIIKTFLPMLIDILIPGLRLLGNIIMVILKILEPILEFLLSDIIIPILDGIVVGLEAITEVLSYLGPVLKTVFGFIEALFSDEWDKFMSDTANLWLPLKEKWDTFWDNFWKENKEKLLKALRIIGGILTGGLSEFIILLVKNWDKIVSFFKPAFNKVYNFIKKYVDTLKSGWNRIKNFFIKDIPQFINNIFNGLKQGLKGNWNSLKNTISNAVKGAVNWVKKLLGIHSPSTVFAEIGEFMMEGLSLGIENGAETEKQVINGVFKDLVSTASDLLNSGDDFTIKVGMDISDVESQTKNIKSLMSGVSNYDPSVTGAYNSNARLVARGIEKSTTSSANTRSSEVYNDNTTNNNTFNITSNNPRAVADEIDKVLQKRAMEKKIARGGI